MTDDQFDGLMIMLDAIRLEIRALTNKTVLDGEIAPRSPDILRQVYSLMQESDKGARDALETA